MLRDPAESIRSCARFLGLVPTSGQIDANHREHAFANVGLPRGRDYPHRQAKAGGWRNSPNFAPAVRAIAESELGELRKGQLGYHIGSPPDDRRTAPPRAAVE